MRRNIFTLLLCFVCAFAAVYVNNQFFQPTEKIIEYRQPAVLAAERIMQENISKQQYFSSSPTNFISAADKGRPAVVFIRAVQKSGKARSMADNLGGSTGSGVIISADGYIATNNHVVEGASTITVMLNDRREYEAKLIGTDPTTDLAIIKIDTYDLPFLTFGDSDSVMVGEWVVAIGNPFRLQSTVTAGIVSAKARNINILEQQGIESFIQTDAAVNPGNSGGALVNTAGDLIGINTAIMTYSGRYEGFSFAIPSNLAKKVIYDIIEFGAVQRGWLGVTILNVNDKRAKELDLEVVGGVFLDRVNNGEAASQAGLKRGDVIIGVNDIPTLSTPEFMEQVGRFRPGDNIKLSYIRNGKEKIAEVTLRNQINSTDYVAIRKDKIFTDLGFELRDLDQTEKKRLDTEGIYVVSVSRGSKIERTNMDPGYIITKINEKPVRNVQDLLKELEDHKGMVVLEGFYENYPGEFPYAFIME
ncbi:Do family serine endopeptidase [Portibacter marinus]|uniref:Do family serine endopeptidase n=1 Tax=Portibacter marinus TaxID=2898660 RepID=UPI001F2D3413|nr:Do family serine endopeptidase [Portibacter marinus]